MSLMYAEMGMKIVGGLAEMAVNKEQYKMQVATQKYQRKMTALSAAFSTNTLTGNEISLRDAGIRAAGAIQMQARKDQASNEAGAAAAGVTGGSVLASQRGLKRSALSAGRGLSEARKGEDMVSTDARRKLALDVAFQRDTTVLSRPSTAMALLGLGATLIDTYDSHQPKGSQTSDAIAGWFRK